jgi:hypothetical protein
MGGSSEAYAHQLELNTQAAYSTALESILGEVCWLIENGHLEQAKSLIRVVIPEDLIVPPLKLLQGMAPEGEDDADSNEARY